MILRALYDYYQRCLVYEPNSLPMYGRMDAVISFIVVIRKDGTFVRIEDVRDEGGNGMTFRYPKGIHSNAETPFLFWDKCMYALDFSNANKPLSAEDAEDEDKVKKWKKSLAKAHEKHLSFVERCKKVAINADIEDLWSVVRFYEKNQLAELRSDLIWSEIEKKPDVNVSFRIEGSLTTIAELNELLNYIDKDSDQKGVCLITGLYSDIIRKSTPTPIRGCKNSASLVSFQTDSGYDSYGKKQAYNAPISLEAEFAYSTALTKLLQKNSRNTFFIVDRQYLFWSSVFDQSSKVLEESIFNMFGYSDNPDAKCDNLKQAFLSIFNGKKSSSSADDMFYVLGIAPNAGREAVVYYNEVPIAEFAENILQHFNDMEIIGTRNIESFSPGLYEILKAVVQDGDIKKCPSNLPDALVKSIFQRDKYPVSLYQACIRRIRAESSKNVSPSIWMIRAAIIKAYLNRLNDNNNKINRLNDNNNKKIDIGIMLDKEKTNQGYLCGRLFAVLDKVQEKANGIHSIRERYMNSASATPAAVFPTILNLSIHHLEKLNVGRQIFFEKLKQEIISKLDADGFPALLDLQDQGRFFVGYYHQRQDLDEYKEDKDQQ